MPKTLLLLFATVPLFMMGCDNTNTAEKPDAKPVSQSTSASGSSGVAENPDANSDSMEPVEVSRGSANEPNPAMGNPATKSDSAAVALQPNKDVAFSLKFLSWNVESDGSDPQTIAKELSELGSYDIIALTEVLPQSAKDFCEAFGDEFNYVMSDTGRNDRLVLVYNSQAIRFVKKFELHDINFKSKYRSPLVVHFQDILTGKEMLVMVNHLARGNAETRQIQATKLVDWARDQTMPTVALGDYNFDFEFDTREGNESFRLFMKDSVWKWVEPIELIDTNWYDNPDEPDGKDDYPGSMLDFAFVAGPAKDWTTSCKVIVREGDFPDDEKTSDHRPYEVIVSGQ